MQRRTTASNIKDEEYRSLPTGWQPDNSKAFDWTLRARVAAAVGEMKHGPAHIFPDMRVRCLAPLMIVGILIRSELTRVRTAENLQEQGGGS
jgi:hypothetical protein